MGIKDFFGLGKKDRPVSVVDSKKSYKKVKKAKKTKKISGGGKITKNKKTVFFQSFLVEIKGFLV